MVKINIKDEYLSDPELEFTEHRQFLKLSWIKQALDTWMWVAEVQYASAFDIDKAFRPNCDALPHMNFFQLALNGNRDLTEAEKNSGMMTVPAEDREYLKC